MRCTPATRARNERRYNRKWSVQRCELAMTRRLVGSTAVESTATRARASGREGGGAHSLAGARRLPLSMGESMCFYRHSQSAQSLHRVKWIGLLQFVGVALYTSNHFVSRIIKHIINSIYNILLYKNVYI